MRFISLLSQACSLLPAAAGCFIGDMQHPAARAVQLYRISELTERLRAIARWLYTGMCGPLSVEPSCRTSTAAARDSVFAGPATSCCGGCADFSSRSNTTMRGRVGCCSATTLQAMWPLLLRAAMLCCYLRAVWGRQAAASRGARSQQVQRWGRPSCMPALTKWYHAALCGSACSCTAHATGQAQTSCHGCSVAADDTFHIDSQPATISLQPRDEYL